MSKSGQALQQAGFERDVLAALTQRGWEPVPASAGQNLETQLQNILQKMSILKATTSESNGNALKREITNFVNKNAQSLKHGVHNHFIQKYFTSNSDGSKTIALTGDVDALLGLLRLVADCFSIRVDLLKLVSSTKASPLPVPIQTHTFHPTMAATTKRGRVAFAVVDDSSWCTLSPSPAHVFPSTFNVRSFGMSPCGLVAVREGHWKPTRIIFTFASGASASCPLKQVPVPSDIAPMLEKTNLFAFIPQWRRLGSKATVELRGAGKAETLSIHPVLFEFNQTSTDGYVCSPFSDAAEDAHRRGFNGLADTLTAAFGTVHPEAPVMPDLKISGGGSAARGLILVKGVRNPAAQVSMRSFLRDAIAFFQSSATKNQIKTAVALTPWRAAQDAPASAAALFDALICLSLLASETGVVIAFETEEVEQAFLDHCEKLRSATTLDLEISGQTKPLFSRVASPPRRSQDFCVGATTSKGNVEEIIATYQDKISAVISVDCVVSSDILAFSPSKPGLPVPLYRLSNIFSANPFTSSAVIHQASLNHAAADSFMRNLGVTALSGEFADELMHLEKTMSARDGREASVIRVGSLKGENEKHEILSQISALQTADTSRANIIVLSNRADETTADGALVKSSTNTNSLLLLAAVPALWGHLDRLSCLGQLPWSMWTILESQGKGVASDQRFSSAFAEPSFLSPVVPALRFPTVQPKEDPMDVDTHDDNVSTQAKRRKSIPEQSVSFENASLRTKRRQVRAPADLPFFTPEEPAMLPIAEPEPIFLTSKSGRAQTTPAAIPTAASTKPRREPRERDSAPSPASMAPSRAPKAKADISSSGFSITVHPTGAILEPHELLVISSMSSNKRNAFNRSVKSFLLRYGLAPFGGDLEAYTSYFKFNFIRMFRELIVQIGIRLAQASKEAAIEYFKNSLQMTDEEIETVFTITSVLLVVRYIDSSVEALQNRCAEAVEKNWLPQFKKSSWWNAKMEIRAFMWLRENGCPASWSTELDKTWLHNDFVKDGTDGMPRDWKTIAKEMDTHFLPLSQMVKRFFSLIKFLHTNRGFAPNSAASTAANLLLTKPDPNSVRQSALPPLPKRGKHWLAEKDGAIEPEKEHRPIFYTEIAHALVTRFGNDFDLMTAWNLREHHVECLRYCSRPSGAEHLATAIQMIVAEWPSILKAAEEEDGVPVLSLSPADVDMAVAMSSIRRATMPLWKREDHSRVEINFSRATQLYKAPAFSAWLNSSILGKSTSVFPSKTDIFIIFIYCLKFGIPYSLEKETPLLEALIGRADTFSDWRKRKDIMWNEDKAPQSEASIANGFQTFVAQMRSLSSRGRRTERGVLLTLLELFSKQTPLIMGETNLHSKELFELWKAATCRLGLVWDEDDISDVDFALRNQEEPTNEKDVSTKLQEANDWLAGMLEVQAGPEGFDMLSIGQGRISLSDAKLILSITRTRSSRKMVTKLKTVLNNDELRHILWAYSDDPTVEGIKQCLSVQDVSPTLMELALLLVMMEYGIPNDFAEFGKLLMDVFGDQMGKSSSKNGIYSVRGVSMADAIRRIKEVERTADVPRESSKTTKQQLATVFSGENHEILLENLKALGPLRMAEHLAEFAALFDPSLRAMKTEPKSDAEHSSSGESKKRRRRDK